MCSVYGKLTSKELSDRIHECSWCGLVMDRDLNASINIQNYYMIQNTVSSTGIHALGDGSSDCSVTNDFSPSLKKESNGKFTYVLKRSVDFCKF